jgi:hypothetical protein
VEISMKISWIPKDSADDKSIEVEIIFYNDEQTKVLHTLTVCVDDPDRYVNLYSAMRFGGSRKVLDEIIPQMQTVLTEALKTDNQLEMEAKARTDTQ